MLHPDTKGTRIGSRRDIYLLTNLELRLGALRRWNATIGNFPGIRETIFDIRKADDGMIQYWHERSDDLEHLRHGLRDQELEVNSRFVGNFGYVWLAKATRQAQMTVLYLSG